MEYLWRVIKSIAVSDFMQQAVPRKRKERKPPPGWVLYLSDRYNAVIGAIPFGSILSVILAVTAFVIILGATLFMMELTGEIR